MSEWQPIDTAPTDGSRVIGYDDFQWEREKICTTFKSKSGKWVFEAAITPIGWDNYAHDYWEPTHWMPLPTPPGDKGEHYGLATDRDGTNGRDKNSGLVQGVVGAEHGSVLRPEGLVSGRSGVVPSPADALDASAEASRLNRGIVNPTQAQIDAAMEVHVAGSRATYVRRVLEAALAVAPAAVRVKPLEWLKGSYGRQLARGIDDQYSYEVRDTDGGHSAYWIHQGLGLKKIDVSSLSEAQAAAQDDYEARIRAALSTEVEG